MIANTSAPTAVITGAGSGFGLALARLCAQRGMNLALADVQADALELAQTELNLSGVKTLAHRVDVSKASDMAAFADAVSKAFGAPNLVFNNAGVGAGGLIWEHSLKDWEWVMGINVMGVAHGVRLFTPMMLAAAKRNPEFRGHIVNTASMAGMLNAPNMGVYNVSKHAVVSLSETLYQDLALVTDQVNCSVLCPFFVSTGITSSHRNRSAEFTDAGAVPTASQLIAQAMSEKAVGSGRVTAADVAQLVLNAVDANEFYVYSHPQALGSVRVRMEDVTEPRNPTSPFAHKPEIGERLRVALRGG